MNESHEKCIICGQFKVSHFKNFDGWELVKCDNDGLIFVYPQPNETDLSDFYNSGHYFCSINGRFGYKDYLKGKKMLMINNRIILKKIKKSLNKLNLYNGLINPLKLLDIGTAYGFFLEAARDEDFDVYGNDISKEAVSHAKTNGLNVSLGTTKQQNYPPDFFDVVSILGVIEHFNNPKEEIDEAARILKLGGLLIILTISTSNFRGRGAIKPPEHLHYFSNENLAHFLSLHGFKVIKIYPLPTFYGYEELISRLFARIFKPNKFVSKFEKFLLHTVSVLRLNKLLNKIPIPVPDGQILMIAQKQN